MSETELESRTTQSTRFSRTEQLTSQTWLAQQPLMRPNSTPSFEDSKQKLHHMRHYAGNISKTNTSFFFFLPLDPGQPYPQATWQTEALLGFHSTTLSNIFSSILLLTLSNVSSSIQLGKQASNSSTHPASEWYWFCCFVAFRSSKLGHVDYYKTNKNNHHQGLYWIPIYILKIGWTFSKQKNYKYTRHIFSVNVTLKD